MGGDGRRRLVVLFCCTSMSVENHGENARLIWPSIWDVVEGGQLVGGRSYRQRNTVLPVLTETVYKRTRNSWLFQLFRTTTLFAPLV